MIPPVAVYSSPLRRARETAGAFADRVSMAVGIEDDLAEAHLGDWEGKPFEEILRADEQMLHRIRNQEPIWRHAPGVEGSRRSARASATPWRRSSPGIPAATSSSCATAR